MACSTLFWGFDIKVESRDWEKVYAQAKGLGPKPKRRSSTELWEQHKATLVEFSDCKMVGEGFAHGEMHDLPAISASITQAYDFDTVQMIGEVPEVKPDWEQKLRDYCEVLKIDVSHLKPGWILAYSWE